MTTGKDSILNVLRLGNLVFWKLRNLQGTRLIAENEENDTATLDGSISHFEQYLELLGPGQYEVEAWSTLNDKKNRKKIPFEIPAGVAGLGIGTLPIQIPAGVSPEEIQSKIDKALEEYKTREKLQNLEEENRDLKRQIKELEGNDNNPWNRIIGKLEPFVDPIMKAAGLGMPAGSISGTSEKNVSTDEYQKRLEAAFDKWLEVESGNEVIRLVEAIAQLAKTGDQKYNLAKQML